MQEYCPVLLDLPNSQENFKVTFSSSKLCKNKNHTHTHKPNMGQFGTKVISLQPVAQNKVMSVEMKKEKLKGYYEGRIVIVISWVWAEEMGNNG